MRLHQQNHDLLKVIELITWIMAFYEFQLPSLSEGNPELTSKLFCLAKTNHRNENLLHICAQMGNEELLIIILKSRVADDQSLTDAVNSRFAFKQYVES